MCFQGCQNWCVIGVFIPLLVPYKPYEYSLKNALYMCLGLHLTGFQAELFFGHFHSVTTMTNECHDLENFLSEKVHHSSSVTTMRKAVTYDTLYVIAVTNLCVASPIFLRLSRPWEWSSRPWHLKSPLFLQFLHPFLSWFKVSSFLHHFQLISSHFSHPIKIINIILDHHRASFVGENNVILDSP